VAKENKSRLAVLGMLTLGPMSGYDIRKAMEQSTGNFWQESYGQIYPILKQLTNEGLATSREEKQEGSPVRYVYTLTDKGWDELGTWLSEPIEYQVERNELLLKLFFGRIMPIPASIEHVGRFRMLQEQSLRKYEQIEAHLARCAVEEDPDAPYSLITVRYGLHRVRALIDWCDETIAALNKLAENGPAEQA
jgi:PadR family transcriptional regulator, regulatory protein AphA